MVRSAVGCARAAEAAVAEAERSDNGPPYCRQLPLPVLPVSLATSLFYYLMVVSGEMLTRLV